MDPQDLIDFIGRLIGRKVMPEEHITLSSGRRARLAAWLQQHGSSAQITARIAATSFRPIDLLASGFDPAPAPRSPAPELAAETTGTSGLRIGIDIQWITEMFGEETQFDPKSSAELTGVFTLRELSYAQSRTDVRETLAGLFAAKEALRKSDRRLLLRVLTDIEILPDADGRPAFPGFALSISHSGGFAIAVAAAAAGGPVG